MDGNFDAVMGFVGCVIGLEETHHKSRTAVEEDVYDSLDKEFIRLFRDNKNIFNIYT